MTEDLRFPIGRFAMPAPMLTPAQRLDCIQRIAAAPTELRAAVRGLSPEQLATPYRPGGWTVRQVVHHIADSHINAFCRLKLTLTEDCPTIKPYRQEGWADLPDGSEAAIEASMALVEGMHERWVVLLRSLKPEDFQKKFNHPESGLQTIDRIVALYSWHGAHHIAHITSLRARHGW